MLKQVYRTTEDRLSLRGARNHPTPFVTSLLALSALGFEGEHHTAKFEASKASLYLYTITIVFHDKSYVHVDIWLIDMKVT